MKALTYFYNAYKEHTGVTLPPLTMKGHRQFENRTSSIRSQYGWNDDDLKELIDWMYVTNPLDLPDLIGYGSVRNLSKCAYRFAGTGYPKVNWRENPEKTARPERARKKTTPKSKPKKRMGGTGLFG